MPLTITTLTIKSGTVKIGAESISTGDLPEKAHLDKVWLDGEFDTVTFGEQKAEMSGWPRKAIINGRSAAEWGIPALDLAFDRASVSILKAWARAPFSRQCPMALADRLEEMGEPLALCALVRGYEPSFRRAISKIYWPAERRRRLKTWRKLLAFSFGAFLLGRNKP